MGWEWCERKFDAIPQVVTLTCEAYEKPQKLVQQFPWSVSA